MEPLTAMDLEIAAMVCEATANRLGTKAGYLNDLAKRLRGAIPPPTPHRTLSVAA